MKHERTEMKKIDRYPIQHTYRTGRRGNIWYYVVECPVCKRRIYPAANPNRQKVFKCVGLAASQLDRPSVFTFKPEGSIVLKF